MFIFGVSQIVDFAFGDQVCGMAIADIILPPRIKIDPPSITYIKVAIFYFSVIDGLGNWNLYTM